MRTLALLSAVVLLGAAGPRSAPNYFLGNWTCAGTPWSWTPLVAGDGGWIRNVYGDPKQPDGTAVIGYVSGLQKYVYRDFHADGSYADLASAGLVDGRWEWSGPYYPASGGPALTGRITYVVVSPIRYDRIFEAQRDGSMVRMGGDTCTKV